MISHCSHLQLILPCIWTLTQPTYELQQQKPTHWLKYTHMPMDLYIYIYIKKNSISLIPDSITIFSLTSCTFALPSTYYWLLPSRYLTFNSASAKYKLLPFSGIRFNVPLFTYIYFIKRVKPKSAAIHSWFHKTNYSCFVIYTISPQTTYHTYANK